MLALCFLFSCLISRFSLLCADFIHFFKVGSTYQESSPPFFLTPRFSVTVVIVIMALPLAFQVCATTLASKVPQVFALPDLFQTSTAVVYVHCIYCPIVLVFFFFFSYYKPHPYINNLVSLVMSNKIFKYFIFISCSLLSFFFNRHVRCEPSN